MALMNGNVIASSSMKQLQEMNELYPLMFVRIIHSSFIAVGEVYCHVL
jgi:hypothetical protein